MIWSFSPTLDIFPNWPNSLPTAKLQMIGHALLSTNFNTLKTHLLRWSCGIFLASYDQKLGVQILALVGEFLILENLFL